jgi:hypothetical protein
MAQNERAMKLIDSYLQNQIDVDQVLHKILNPSPPASPSLTPEDVEKMRAMEEAALIHWLEIVKNRENLKDAHAALEAIKNWAEENIVSMEELKKLAEYFNELNHPACKCPMQAHGNRRPLVDRLLAQNSALVEKEVDAQVSMLAEATAHVLRFLQAEGHCTLKKQQARA